METQSGGTDGQPSRWTAEKRYQIVKEALSQKEPVGQIARRHQVSEGLIYRWRDKFFEGGKAALAFDGRNVSHGEKPALERQIEELQKLIGSRRSRSVFKTAVEELRPSWAEVEVARVAEGLTVKRAMKLSGLSRSSYYRQVRGMKDYRERGRQVPSAQHREVLREWRSRKWKRDIVEFVPTRWREER